jgi:glycerol-3-phosphate dehydrogenase
LAFDTAERPSRNSATYYDAWVSHPERIGIELLRDGLSAGSNAKALNYATVEQMGAGEFLLRDRVSGETLAIQPRLVINATGGWIDIANGALFPQEARPAPLMGGTKGSHLIIDNAGLRDMLDGHMIYYENEDGRICILFPYLGKVLVGSTDIRVDDPGTVRCEADERDYILQSLAFVLPGIKIQAEEIVFQFAGVRPLPASNDSFTGRIPRDHFCTVLEGRDGGPPVLCMIGGKWTTFRSFGEMAADMALERLGKPRRIDTAERTFGGGRAFPKDRGWVRDLAASTGIAADRAASLFERYGTDAEDVARFIAAAPDHPLPHAGYSVRELIHLIRSEAVEHLDDLITRRTTLAITGELSLAMAEAVLDVLAAEKGWPTPRKIEERTRFLTLMRERHGVAEEILSARNEQRSELCETTARSG